MAQKKKMETCRIKIVVSVPVEMVEKRLKRNNPAEGAEDDAVIIMPKDGWESVLEQVRKQIGPKLKVIRIAY